MENKDLKITFNKGGSGSITPRLSLPAKWIREMGLDQDNREIKARFEEDKIILEKRK